MPLALPRLGAGGKLGLGVHKKPQGLGHLRFYGYLFNDIDLVLIQTRRDLLFLIRTRRDDISLTVVQMTSFDDTDPQLDNAVALQKYSAILNYNQYSLYLYLYFF